MNHKLESRLLGEISITSDRQMTPPIWQKVKKESLLMKVKEESENVGLNSTFRKLRSGIWSHHFMANRCGNSRNSDRLYFEGLQNHSKITVIQFSSIQSLSHLRLCDPMNCSKPGIPVHYQLPELTQTQVHCVSDAIQPSHPLLYPLPPALNLSQHQDLFK